MDTILMGKVVVSAKIENLEDLFDAEKGLIAPDAVRSVEVHDALIDTGARGLLLPRSMVASLGLRPLRVRQARGLGGTLPMPMFRAVRLTIQGRDCAIDQARSGSDEAVTELREIIAKEVAELERRGEEAWQGVEKPRLRDWCSGLEMDLGPEGTRLHRYEAAADRLFRSAWTKLERLRKERGEPLFHRGESGYVAEPAARSEPTALSVSEPVPSVPAPVRPETALPFPARLDDPPTALDFWIGGPPRTGISPSNLIQYKTNPTPSLNVNGGRAARRRNLT